jgi:hypothetical protein
MAYLNRSSIATQISNVLVLICLFIACASAASGVTWTKSYNLQQGQAVIHQTQVDGYAEFTLVSPPRAQFELYATQIASAGAQSCPSEVLIRKQASYRSNTAFILPQGQWCIEVYAMAGSGTYTLYAAAAPGPGPLPPTPIPVPSISPKPETPYKVSNQIGALSEGGFMVHQYLVSSQRTYLEWIVEPMGCLNPPEIPTVMMSEADGLRMHAVICPLSLDMYVYKDCDPRHSTCTPIASDTSGSSYAYVGISYPQDKSRYYVMIKGVTGSGSYSLTSRSYIYQNSPIVMMSLFDEA